MHLIQAERGGWFSTETVKDTADLFEVPDVHVQGHGRFLRHVPQRPGRQPRRPALQDAVVQAARRGRTLRAHIKTKYGVDHGETTKDGAFTFRCFECLGHCSTAPMMLVDEEKYEDLTVESLDAVLGGLA